MIDEDGGGGSSPAQDNKQSKNKKTRKGPRSGGTTPALPLPENLPPSFPRSSFPREKLARKLW